MPVDKLAPNDPRVTVETAQIRGKRYEYTLGEPEGTPVATMLLIHGFPDLAFGWRYQVPYFVSLGFRVVVPDMIGYGGTEAPEDLEAYTLKSIAADMKELARRFVGEDGQIVLGGHDWGGAAAWRVALWHPELILAIFSVCTPFIPPAKTFTPLADVIAAGHLVNFTYQLQFAGPDVEEGIRGSEKTRQFLNALYGGRGDAGETGFTTLDGVKFDALAGLNPTALVSGPELDHYAEQYLRNGEDALRGPLNWYRMRELNFRDEEEGGLAGTDRGRQLKMPALFITATEDAALPPGMAAGMDRCFDDLTRGEVKASHWALWQAAEAVNAQVGRWANGVLGGALRASL